MGPIYEICKFDGQCPEAKTNYFEEKVQEVPFKSAFNVVESLK